MSSGPPLASDRPAPADDRIRVPGPVYLAALWAPLAAVSVAAKLYESAMLGALRGPGSAFAVCAHDLIFFGVGYCVWTLLLRLRGARARTVSLAVLHVLVPLMAIFLVIDLAFFVVTGTLGDWYLLKEGLKGFWALRNLYLSQMTPLRAAGLLLPWAYSAAVFLVHKWVRQTAGWATRPASNRSVNIALGVGASAALTGLLSLTAPIPGGMQALRRTAIGGMMEDVTEDAFSQIGKRRHRKNDSSGTPVIVGPTSLVRSGKSTARNVVVVVLESTGAAYTSLLGGPYDNTPNLKSLAARGALVEQAYTVVPHTSKSLVSILCGFYPELSPSIDEAKPQGIPRPCLPRLLSQQGYQTAFFQTAEQNYELRADLVDQLGFSHFQGKESIDGRGFDESSYFGWEDDAMLPAISAWLDQQGDNPFFLTVVTLTSHHPYGVPRGFPTKSYASQKDLNDFLNTIAYTDRFVGKLTAELDRRGRLKDTLLVVLGDHGEGLGQHGRREHDAVPYEEGVHVPVVMVGPDIAPGTRVTGLRQLTDVAPTAAHELGFEGNVPFFGSDLLRDQPHERVLVFCYYKDYCADAIDADGTKVIYHFHRFPTELFRLTSDPEERHNLLIATGEPHTTRTHIDAVERQITETINQDNLRYEMQGMVQTSLFVSRTRPPTTGQAIEATFGDSVRVIDYSVDPPVIEPGGRTVISTTFQVVKAPPPTWNLFMHLESPSGLFNADHVPAEGTYPVSQWRTGDFVKDRFVFTTRPAAELEDYTVRIGFWDRANGRRAPVHAEPPLVVTGDDRLQLGTLSVKKTHIVLSQFVTSAPPSHTDLDIRFGDCLRLISSSIDRPITKAGLKTTASYDFQVLRSLGDRYELKVDLDGPTGRMLFHKPVYGEYPLTRWAAGQFVRDPHEIVTLTSDPVGKYKVLLSVVDKQTGQRLPVSGIGRPMPDPFHVEAAAYEIVR
jgi:lipoteichoic acid synthase